MSAYMLKRNPGVPIVWYTVSELALLVANITVLGFISTCLEHCDSERDVRDLRDDCDSTIYGRLILVFTLFFR
jgi:hypothetical protein